MSRKTPRTTYALLILLVLSVLLVLGAACSGDGLGADGGAPPDATADSAMIPVDGAVPFVPELPRIDWLSRGAPEIASPAPPSMTPCPDGWRQVEIDGIAACDPWPASGVGLCGAYEAHFPSALGCSPVGTACAADGWPTGLPSSDILYVRQGASGDGTRGAPYGRMTDALTSATATTTIAVAAGRYDEAVTVPTGVSVVGVCPELTVITRTVTIEGDGASLRNVSVEGASPGISVHATATVRDVVISATTTAGMRVTGGALSAENISIRDTASGSPGLLVAAGAAATVTGGAFVNSSGNAAEVSGVGARLTLTDVALTDAGGRGLSVGPGASAVVDASAIEGNSAANVSHGGGTTSLTDVVLRGDGPPMAAARGQGLVITGGSVTLSRVLASTNHRAGIEIQRGALSATDLIVVDTLPNSTEASSGIGVLAYRGTLSLERAHLARNTFCGMALTLDTGEFSDIVITEMKESEPLADRGTWGFGMLITAAEANLSRIRVTHTFGVGMRFSDDGVYRLTDGTVTDLRPGSGTDRGGEGVIVNGSARLEATRVLVERAHFAGFAAADGGSMVLEDIVSRDVPSPSVFATGGYGIYVDSGADVSLSRGLVEQARVSGVHAVDGSTFSGEDVVIREMIGDEHLGLHGWGVGATAGGQAELNRVHIFEARYVALLSTGPSSSIVGADVTVEDTLEATCAADLCADAPFGIGVGAYGGASVGLDSFKIARSHVIGVQLAGGGVVDLTNGEVSTNPIGVNVQADAFDIDRLTLGVTYVDNAQNLDTAELPVPSVGGL